MHAISHDTLKGFEGARDSKTNDEDIEQGSEVSSSTVTLPHGGDIFPKIETILTPKGKKIPKIIIQDWTDEEYFKHFGEYLEDRAGTGIYRIMENHPPCLKINDSIYSKGVNIFTYPKKTNNLPVYIEVVFEDCYARELKKKCINFENVGPYVLKYRWKKVSDLEKTDFPLKNAYKEQRVYFDLRPGILVPGEKKTMNVVFKTKYTGVYKEDWELVVTPQVHNNIVIFNFRAIAVEKTLIEPWKGLEEGINRSVAISYAKYILKCLVRKATEQRVIITEPKHIALETEQEVFLYINERLYSYDLEIVTHLKEMHMNIFNEKWDLCLFDLEEKIKTSTMVYERHAELNKFKQYKIKLIKSKENLLVREYYMKYNTAFQILGEALEDIQFIITESRRKYGLKPILPIPPSEKPSYFYFPEFFSSTSVQRKSESKLPVQKKPAGLENKKGGNGKKTVRKREYIELAPKEPFIMRRKEWEPENPEYETDVYEAVYSTLCSRIDELTLKLQSHKERISYF